MTPGGRRVVAVAVVLAVVTAATWAGPGEGSASAAGDGGASSHVTRDGRIITSILLGRRVHGPKGGTAERTYWLTLSDAEIGFLLDVVASRPELASTPLFVALEPLLADGRAGSVDLQILIVDGRATTQVRAVPAPPGAARALARRMITELPALAVTMSPPPGAVVPVGEPVFVSFRPDVWSTVVDRSLTAGGVTARVRAHPVSFRASSGDPSEAYVEHRCTGPGRAFDADDPASPATQARRPDACVLTYDTATGVRGRRDRWYGDHTVVWRAEWTTDGVTWRSLGDIPRITVFTRQVRTVTTSIESDR